MPHLTTPEAEALLDKEFPVLDKGFVRLVDYMGSDQRIVAAARVSYGTGTKTVREDEVLINYLMRHEHTSPLEQVVLTFHVKLPIFVARQWIRHRTARVNEISGRYSVMKDECYLPAEETLRTQSTINKQGRAETPVSPEAATDDRGADGRRAARGLRALRGHARLGPGPRGGAHRATPQPLHGVVLADRPAQSFPLPQAPSRRPRPVGDPGVRQGHGRDHEGRGSHGLRRVREVRAPAGQVLRRRPWSGSARTSPRASTSRWS